MQSSSRFALHSYKYNVLFIGLGSQLAWWASIARPALLCINGRNNWVKLWASHLRLRESPGDCWDFKTFPLPSSPVVTMSTLQLNEKLNMRLEAKPILKNNFSEILKLLKKVLSTAVSSNPTVFCTKSIILTSSPTSPSRSSLLFYFLVIILIVQVMKTQQTLALTTISFSLTTSTYLRASVVSCKTFHFILNDALIPTLFEILCKNNLIWKFWSFLLHWNKTPCFKFDTCRQVYRGEGEIYHWT